MWDRVNTKGLKCRLNMLILALFVSLGGMLASTAGASWGPQKECYRDASESHHCYAVEVFEMSGYPREAAVAGRRPTRRNSIEGHLFHGEPSPGHRANYHPQVAAGWLVRAYRRALGERPPLATTRTGPHGGFWLALNAGHYLVAGVRPDGSSCPGTFVRVGQHPASVSLGCGK